eukprot:gene15223-16797_t
MESGDEKVVVQVQPASDNSIHLEPSCCAMDINDQDLCPTVHNHEHSAVQNSSEGRGDDTEKEVHLYPEDARLSKSVARQKLFSVVRNMQQQHIAELFPIIADSRETTESSEEVNICRICHTGGDEQLVAPCKCRGSAQFVHATCLLTWFKKSVKNSCELCQEQVPIKKKNRPISEWKRPEGRPIPLIWFIVFFVGLCLNILSIQVNAAESCKSTACLIFYVVNGFGIVLDAAFLWFWSLKCRVYWRKWCAINQDWFINQTKSVIITMSGTAARESLKSPTNQEIPQELASQAKLPKDQIVNV